VHPPERPLFTTSQHPALKAIPNAKPAGEPMAVPVPHVRACPDGAVVVVSARMASRSAMMDLQARRQDNEHRLAEKATLEDVEKDGEVLLLKDGRRLKVNNPDDATVASIWMPSANMTLRKRKGPAFSVSVTNEDTGEMISATAETR
jgi:hypothetical protein